ncbi:branched-chain amino acid ABC transporter permease [Pseudohoeflea coraliihabitans]|uniref:Branched-chain amino acid ABC transporter permease n=1 Tax=Pseudohoeflea coraliihabitans TaxID=2860393 RepID=A0ABS6WJA2_9HYPH|nr:branched-chain amino acid ABC transporter permease [Pseudohoeflea sp. DP4N28-3]MBW3096019.1 branched-chain amino acid ABC transporter permease [Pseudohoeflea sp. DP4N28-3]
MLEHALNIVTTASIFFLVSAGLLFVLSVMGVVNLAHGAFLTVGGYSGVVISQIGLNPWLSLLFAPLIGFMVGLVTELLLVRRLYNRPLDTILATWGLSIVLVQLLSTHFGRSAHFVDEIMTGMPYEVWGLYISPYKIFVVAIAVSVGLALYLALRFTDAGVVARAVVLNPELARLLGINTRVVNLITFGFGSALAAFAGSVIVPMSSVDPNMGTPWVITAFMVVLVAGFSLPALGISALLLAAAQVLATYYVAPVIGSVLVIAIPIVLLRFAPDGIVGIMKSR